MTKKLSLDQVFAKWQRKFTADALADDCTEIRRHIKYLELDCTPEAMLEGTGLLLSAVMVYTHLDGGECETLIKQQRYRLGGEGLAFYCLTFNFGKGHFGRILTDEKIDGVDFADLFDHPWHEYKTAGFNEVWISRLDGQPIGDEKMNNLYYRVRDDFYFDNTEEDLSVSVDMTELDDTAIAVATEHRGGAFF